MYSRIHYHLDRLQAMGHPPAALLEGTGLTLREAQNPWPLLKPETFVALVRNMYRLTADPALSFSLCEGFTVGSLGLPGFAVVTSDTFGEARKLMIRYRPLMDAAVFPVHHFSNGRWIITLQELFPLEGEAKRFSFESYLVMSQHFCREVTRRMDFVTRVDFNFPEPAYGGLYRQYFSCELRFDQPQCQVFYDPALLDYPLPLANREVHDLCVLECELRFATLTKQESMARKIHELLYRNHSLHGHGFLSLEEVASRQYLSARTLRRRLADEGITFVQLLADVRRDLALYYLRETQLSVKEISFSLGYSSVPNFYRAFREWTGKHLSEVRAPR
ncbi:MAG: AraC family transcriptional regulator [Pseudomonadota bacterium]|nr:AraC family transcriptional regulator [Pseudomonadota bacterium]